VNDPLDFDAVDYLHCFADDATGCTVSASKTIHSIADSYAAQAAEIARLRAQLAEGTMNKGRIDVTLATSPPVDNPADGPYARGAAAGSRLAARLRDRADWPEIFADMGIMLDAARAEQRTN
jgi:hypothetical protein